MGINIHGALLTFSISLVLIRRRVDPLSDGAVATESYSLISISGR